MSVTLCSFLGRSGQENPAQFEASGTWGGGPNPFLGRAAWAPRWGRIPPGRRDLEEGPPGPAGAPGGRYEARPDLLDVLADAGLDEEAQGDVRRFRRAIERSGPGHSVASCRIDDSGHFLVALHSHARPGPVVGPGDAFLGGVRLFGSVSAGTIDVETRVFRLHCRNGASAYIGIGGPCYRRLGRDRTEGDLAQVVENAMSGTFVPRIQADLVLAARLASPDLDDPFVRSLAPIPPDLMPQILAAARSEAPSLYGLYNALTRTARDHPSVRTAVELEKGAGRLVAVLTHWPSEPARHKKGAIVA